jgi:hypothetical protein
VHSLGKLLMRKDTVATDHFNGGASDMLAQGERKMRSTLERENGHKVGQELSRFCRFAPSD